MTKMETELSSMLPISQEEFWDNVSALPPLLRLGFSDGPGAFMCSEPWELRRCAITGKMDNSYRVSVVLDIDGEQKFFVHDGPLTINEFKALCDQIMPGVGVCDMRWGAKLLDEHGNVRADIKYPVRLGRH